MKSRNHVHIDARVLKHALMAGINRVLAERDLLNRINVFPVPDGDTGSNLGFTLITVRDGLKSLRGRHVGSLFERLASEAIDAARGNSGAILAQFLQGLSEHLVGHSRLAVGTLADAASLGASQARLAIAEPREGTMLSVISAFASALRLACDQGAEDLRVAFSRALAASREALANTPNQLPVLRRAGVVDAGAQGFLNLLEGIDDYIVRGRSAMQGTTEAHAALDGVMVSAEIEADATHRWCSECVLSARSIDRAAVREALDRLDGSSLVIAGTREKLRVHMHVDEPALLFDTLAQFGDVRSCKADDMQAQQRAAHTQGEVVVVIDSAADIPADALETLPLHVVPVRINVGPRDFLDKVSLSADAFYELLRTSEHPVRTSQPPAGDFRRLFEFLLSHHEEVVYVGVSRAISGTLQAGEAASAALGGRVRVIDSQNVSGGQGLLALHAAERAFEGADAATITTELIELREHTRTFAYARDLTSAVRGGRIPAWALPITRWLSLVPMVRIGGGDGRMHIVGVGRDHREFANRFVTRILRSFDRESTWRAQVMHCDNPREGAAVRQALLDQRPEIACSELLEAGSAIGAHAGPGAIVVAIMPKRAPDAIIR
ncbi:MAG TPA: DegV family protein [Dokdonella sp.]|uniref:DegV family protein n=1 Tax=Dokdonella sp. TaxID=2291710 RepID=UPI002D7F044A|nr:DegV family protein [Dokdonella sp.]HET9031632.1 DegV family protein [Dokdonella sp.]